MLGRLEDGDDTRDALFVDRVAAVLHSWGWTSRAEDERNEREDEREDERKVVLYIYTQALMFFIKKQIKIKLWSKFQAKIWAKI